jgi:hypothetical protein
MEMLGLILRMQKLMSTTMEFLLKLRVDQQAQQDLQVHKVPLLHPFHGGLGFNEMKFKKLSSYFNAILFTHKTLFERGIC